MTDAEFKSLIVGGTMLVFLLVSAIIIFLFLLQKRHYRHQQERQKLQQELLKAQLEVQQQTLQHVSQEIHDNIGQLLSIIKISLNTMEESPEPNPHHGQVIKTNGLVSQVINDLRDLSKGLNPDFVEQFGLAGCIQFELERLEHTRKFVTSFSIKEAPYGLRLATEFVIYRVVQELLNNIIKHAGAEKIAVSLVYGTGGLIITINDDGKGFEYQQAQGGAGRASQGGLGLSNIKRRMELIGGAVTISSTINRGTQSVITIPRTINT